MTSLDFTYYLLLSSEANERVYVTGKKPGCLIARFWYREKRFGYGKCSKSYYFLLFVHTNGDKFVHSLKNDSDRGKHIIGKIYRIKRLTLQYPTHIFYHTHPHTHIYILYCTAGVFFFLEERVCLGVKVGNLKTASMESLTSHIRLSVCLYKVWNIKLRETFTVLRKNVFLAAST